MEIVPHPFRHSGEGAHERVKRSPEVKCFNFYHMENLLKRYEHRLVQEQVKFSGKNSHRLQEDFRFEEVGEGYPVRCREQNLLNHYVSELDDLLSVILTQLLFN